jgi:hypothetical protein
VGTQAREKVRANGHGPHTARDADALASTIEVLEAFGL